MRRVIWVAVLGWVMLWVTAAFAQPRDATSQKLDAIREQMERGQGMYLRGDYAEAARLFEAGYRNHPYSAFLFNAGVCYQKLNDLERALASFREYLAIDPAAPDREKVEVRIAALEAASALARRPPAADGAAAAAGSADGFRPPDAPQATVAGPVDDQTAMKSLVVIETEPSGAPIKVYARIDSGAPPFLLEGPNAGWKEVAVARSPANLTLEVGHYHVFVEEFRDLNASQADIDVLPGHVHHFKANLSQGEFMAFLRVSGNVRGAHLYLDDPHKKRPPWGTAPHGELVSPGKHALLVEAPGFEPFRTDVELQHGAQREVEFELVRLNRGSLRFDGNALELVVFVNGRARGVWRRGEPPLQVEVASGPHQVVLHSEGRKSFQGEVLVPRGQVLPVHARMIPKVPRGAAWTEAILSAAFIGAGVYLGLESDRLHDDLQRDRRAGALEPGDSRISKGRWFAIGANTGFGIGALLGIMSTYDFVKDPLPESSVRSDDPVEFDDPVVGRPTASRKRFAVPVARSTRRHTGPDSSLNFRVGANGLAIGGTF